MVASPAAFKEWIERLAERRFKSLLSIPFAIGMQPAAFDQAFDVGRFHIVHVMRLAKLSDEPPSQVLRLAGHGAAANLIEQLYPGEMLAPPEKELVDLFRGADDGKRDLLLMLAREFASSTSADPREIAESAETPAPASMDLAHGRGAKTESR